MKRTVKRVISKNALDNECFWKNEKEMALCATLYWKICAKYIKR